MVEIISSDKTYLEQLEENDRNKLMMISERLSLDCDFQMTKEQLATNLRSYLEENPMMLVKMLQREAIEFLFELWNRKEPPLILDPYQRYLYQLEFLGFIKVIDHKTVEVNLEVEDLFFFYLKSHRMNEVMEQYSRWEQMIFGMMFYYGILDLYYCFEIFDMLVEEAVTYDEFCEFIKVHIMFWNHTLLLRSEGTNNLYLANREVMNRNEVFEHWQENMDVGFRVYSQEDYISMALGNGITTWDGVKELFQFVLDEVEEDKYKCMILVKSIILMIQNGMSYLDIVMKSSSMIHENKKREEELLPILKQLFYSTPIYGLKGYSRQELSEERQEPFHIIDGGKTR